MSRIGKKPIALPANVKVAVNGYDVLVESGSNKLAYTHRPEVTVRVDEGAKTVVVDRESNNRMAKAVHECKRWWRSF